MLVILTNIPTPYRTAFFNILNKELKNIEMEFHVLYCAKTEPRRFWDFKKEEQDYSFSFLGINDYLQRQEQINIYVDEIIEGLDSEERAAADLYRESMIPVMEEQEDETGDQDDLEDS